MKILVFAGSLRQESWNKKLAAQAAEILRGMGQEAEVYDIGGLPMLNEDLEKDGPPPRAAEFRAAVAGADALVICTPEYNYSLPGPTKNALDWLSRPPVNVLAGKTVAIAGATSGHFGTVNAQRELRYVLARLGAFVIPQPWVQVAYCEKKFDQAGRLTDGRTAEQLAELMAQLVATAQKLK